MSLDSPGILGMGKIGDKNQQGTNQSPYAWKAPKSWVEKPSNNIRIGSFDLPTPKDRDQAELSVIILAGNGGGLAPNINRWRGQIGLADQNETEIRSQLKIIKTKLGNFYFVSMNNPKTKTGILAAFITLSSGTLFVKAMGPTNVLKREKQHIIRFIEGIYER